MVTVLMGRRISKPMQRLATAADRFGRGEEVGDLAEAGPAEMRSTVRAFNLTGGTGLGLAIARTIVRGHGGDIRLENREGGGLRATVTLPGVEGA